MNDVVDELGAAKNIEANQVKDKRLQDIRNHERENAGHYKEYIKLLETVVPCLKQVVEDLPRANQLASWLRSDATTIERLKGHYNSEYQENIEAVGHGARGVPDSDQVTRVLEWLSGDLAQYEVRQRVVDGTGIVTEDEVEVAEATVVK